MKILDLHWIKIRDGRNCDEDIVKTAIEAMIPGQTKIRSVPQFHAEEDALEIQIGDC